MPENLYRQGSTWYYRKQVPVDLRHAVYRGKKELRGTLATKDLAEAKRRLRGQLDALDTEFDAHRAKLREGDQEREYLRSDRFQKIRKAIPAATVGMNLFSRLPDDRAEALAMIEAQLELNLRDTENGAELPVEGIRDERLTIDVPVRFADAMLDRYSEILLAERASLEALKAQVESREEREPSLAPTTTEGLASLIPRWQRERAIADKTVSEAKKAISRFEKACGPLAYRAITTEHMRQFKDYLLGLELQAATKVKQWSLVTTLLNQAVANGLLASSPVGNISLQPADDSTHRDIFSRDQLLAIFGHLEAGHDDWWLCRILLYTGARLGEIHQLHRRDVVERDGIQQFQIDRDFDRTVKTENSVRDVPVHAQLIRDGIEAWLPKDDDTPLFSGSNAAASKRLNRRLSAAGLEASRYVVHSFRHTFKSAARAVMGEEFHDKITGHRSQRIGRTYGEHRGLKEKIDLVKFGIETE